MHQSAAMGSVEGLADLADEIYRSLGRQPALSTQDAAEVFALHVSHRDE